MTSSFVLGIDAGQTVTKAVLFDASGRAVATGRVDTTVDSPRPGWHERDMTLLWHDAAGAIASCLRAAGGSGHRIAAVGLCGHNDGVYAVDDAGRPVRPAILATDSRAREYAERFGDQALALTGQVPFAGSPAAVCAWLRDREPHTLERARWLLFAKDWLRLCLTGEAGTDPTEASASFADVRTQDYSGAALDLYGLSTIAGKLPPILPAARVAGRVTPTAAAETGLAAGTPVVTGAHDTDAAALGMGAIGPGAISIIMGTFAVNQVVTPDVRPDPRWLARPFLRPGRWLHMSNSPSSASNLEWAARVLGPHTSGRPDIAAAVASGFTVDTADAPLFLPFLYGTTAGACFAGISGHHTAADLLRAVLDGVVFSHRTHLDELRHGFALSGTARLGGGGARSTQWSQLLADVTELALEVTDAVEAGARGAAALAGIGIGWYSSLEDAVAATVRVTRRHDPRPTAVLRERFEWYGRLVAAMRDQPR
ncbi:MAG TPA: FGGY-family carbohydrate kinase [Actinoplanes sp.]|jgi:L-xylulokinase